MVCQSGNNQSQRRPSWLWMNIIRKNHPCKMQITPQTIARKSGQVRFLFWFVPMKPQISYITMISCTHKDSHVSPILQTSGNQFQDDTRSWELADLYVAHGEIVTNRAVPNLLNKNGVGNRVSCKYLISMLLQNGWCRTSGVGDRKTNKPAPKGWLAV